MLKLYISTMIVNMWSDLGTKTTKQLFMALSLLEKQHLCKLLALVSHHQPSPPPPDDHKFNMCPCNWPTIVSV